jgi:hypothetical protein
MRLSLCVSFILVATVVASGQDTRTIKTEKINGLICTNVTDWKSVVKATEFWTPTKEDVLAAEDQITAYLKKNPKFHMPDLWRKLPEYSRQYLGIVVNGHRRIFCTFFCSADLPLTDKPFVEFDGGECFFRVQYDVDEKQCYDFNEIGQG